MSSSRKRRILTVVIALASLIIVPVTVVFPCVARHIEAAHMQQLAPIDSGEIHFTSTLPPGNYFNFFLSVPHDQPLGAPLSGFVSIKEAGQVVIEFLIGSGTIGKFGDPEADGSQRYHLHWPEKTGAGTKGVLRGRHSYEFTIRFSSPPPEGASLWICWLQRGSD